jgi:transcriptional regulator with XRE-family HTH domain
MAKKRAKTKRVSESPFPLRQLLKQFGMSQRKLGLASGIPITYVNRLAQGVINPKWNTILRIVTTLGGDLGDLAPRPTNGHGKKADRLETASVE